MQEDQGIECLKWLGWICGYLEGLANSNQWHKMPGRGNVGDGRRSDWAWSGRSGQPSGRVLVAPVALGKP